jgi:uncharacterized repeat protein (TIGR03803 family)
MKTIRILLGLMMLVVIGAPRSATAQTLTVIYNFCAVTNDSAVCLDGNSPFSLITGTDGNFYGATSAGGSNDFGTVYTITPEGTLTTILEGAVTNKFPDVSLESGGLFYGTTLVGGTNNDGTIFTITTAGTLTTLHQFSGTNGVADGAVPEHLIKGAVGTFYGSTLFGGSNNAGTVFSITSAGTFTTLHVFSGTNGVADGSSPVVSLLSGGLLIGSTLTGGTFNAGTVFQMTTQGTLTTLHQFDGTNGSGPVITPLKDGANFIGTTESGGISNAGTAFLMTDQGTVTTFYQFTGPNSVATNGHTPDGDTPGLAPFRDNTGAFYGGTQNGGTNEQGLIFTLTTSGTLTPVYQFCSSNTTVACLDGSAVGGFTFIVGAGNNIYGVTGGGGANGSGALFKLIPGSGVAGGCSYALGSTNASFAAAGGASTISVITSNGCAWTATNDVNFITITSGSSGSGNGTVHYTVAANATSDSRTGTVTVAGNVFTVTQAGVACHVAPTKTSAHFSAAGGASNVTVTAAATNCAWTATSNDGFIHITSGGGGTGSGTVDYTVDANTNATARSGTMTIAGQTFTVIQAAVPGACTFSLNSTNLTLKIKGGSKSVSVKASGSACDWTAVSNDSFITITSGASGTGNGKVAFTVAGNTNTVPLIGTMTIADETFTVNQDAGGCTYKFGPKSAKFKSAGGSKKVKVNPNLSNCEWTAVSNDAFITITAGTSGVGKGTVSYTVSVNATTNNLTGTMTIAGQPYTVTESGAK